MWQIKVFLGWIVGLASKAVEETKERVKTAIINSDL
jgi:predicted ATPase with chaperone activity